MRIHHSLDTKLTAICLYSSIFIGNKLNIYYRVVRRGIAIYKHLGASRIVACIFYITLYGRLYTVSIQQSAVIIPMDEKSFNIPD